MDFDTSVLISVKVGRGASVIFSAALNKSFLVCSSATTRPVGNAVGQNAFYCPSVECCHDLDRGFGLFQFLQEMEGLLGFLLSWSTR